MSSQNRRHPLIDFNQGGLRHLPTYSIIRICCSNQAEARPMRKGFLAIAAVALATTQVQADSVKSYKVKAEFD